MATRTFALLLALLLASGCSSWNTLQPITQSAYQAAGPASQMRVELADGRVVTLHSPRIEADTLHGLCTDQSVAKSAVFSDDRPRDSCAVAIRDVKAVKIKQGDTLSTVLLIGLPIMLVLIVGAALAGGD